MLRGRTAAEAWKGGLGHDMNSCRRKVEGEGQWKEKERDDLNVEEKKPWIHCTASESPILRY